MKLPAYIISQRWTNGRQFIIGTRDPIFIAEIFESSKIEEAIEKETGHKYGARAEYKGCYYSLIVVKSLALKPSNPEKLSRYFRRAADYYLHNFLKNEFH